MTLSFKVRPSSKVQTLARYFVDITNYEMFPEMYDEFSPVEFKKNELIEMKEYVDDEEVQHKEWNLEIERPYGNYSWKIKYQASLSCRPCLRAQTSFNGRIGSQR
jgi:hypothetical protein